MKIVVIIPTYNERDNIGVLIPALEAEFRRIPHSAAILIVDDNSPDDTAGLVHDFMRRYRNIHLLEGRKAGLGSAYIRGIRYALSVLKADAVVEMDADLSHKPSDVPRLIEELERYDFVIGSRYISGGAVPDDWGIVRRLNSRAGNILSRSICGTGPVRDCTAGFRAIRAAVLRQIDLASMRSRGFCFQVDLLARALKTHASVQEVPVKFIDRSCGSSKLTLGDITEFIVYTVRSGFLCS